MLYAETTEERSTPCHWNLQHSNADVATFLNNLTIQEQEHDDPNDSCVDLTLRTLISLQQTANRTLGVQEGKCKRKVVIKELLHTEGKTNLI